MTTPRTRAAITGGCGDIGLATAQHLARDGYAVTLIDRFDVTAAAERIRDRAPELDGAPHVEYRRADVTNRAELTAVVESMDRIDVMIANAGIGRSAPILDLTVEEWSAHIDTNLTGAFYTGQAAARRMVRDGTAGLLIFTSSWIGSIPWPEMTAYVASKAGIEMLARQFARELAPHAIRANIIAPGIVRAGMARVQLETEPQYAARAARVVPLGRLETVSDVAGAISFLCSQRAEYMTGSKLTIDGGCSLFAFDQPQ